MKISELNNWDKETLRFLARERDMINKPLADPPTSGQLLNLRINGYVIGPNQEVLKIDCHGMLRECLHGIPCRHSCCGLADGKCTQRPFPSCGVPDGTCSLSDKPCFNYCKESVNSDGKMENNS